MKLTNEDFIRKSKEIHGNKYDYSKVVYTSFNSKVEIVCPIHGSFLQLAKNHVFNKRGCSKCKGHLRTTEEFINLANKTHCHKYNYSQTKYEKYDEKLIIICPSHGKFLQSANKHLHGRGCPKCANNIISTNTLFIQKALNIHKNKYNYSLVNYLGNHKKIIIVCPIHGKFEQDPAHHLCGEGCSKCALDPQLNHKGFKRKEYIFPNGRKELVQGYEPWTLDYLLNTTIIEDIIVSGKDKPIISYNYEGKLRNYFPDCFILSSNTIVETKSTWTMKKQMEQNFSKISGSLESGYNIRFLVWDKNKYLVSDITYTSTT